MWRRAAGSGRRSCLRPIFADPQIALLAARAIEVAVAVPHRQEVTAPPDAGLIRGALVVVDTPSGVPAQAIDALQAVEAVGCNRAGEGRNTPSTGTGCVPIARGLIVARVRLTRQRVAPLPVGALVIRQTRWRLDTEIAILVTEGADGTVDIGLAHRHPGAETAEAHRSAGTVIVTAADRARFAGCPGVVAEEARRAVLVTAACSVGDAAQGKTAGVVSAVVVSVADAGKCTASWRATQVSDGAVSIAGALRLPDAVATHAARVWAVFVPGARARRDALALLASGVGAAGGVVDATPPDRTPPTRTGGADGTLRVARANVAKDASIGNTVLLGTTLVAGLALRARAAPAKVTDLCGKTVRVNRTADRQGGETDAGDASLVPSAAGVGCTAVWDLAATLAAHGVGRQPCACDVLPAQERGPARLAVATPRRWAVGIGTAHGGNAASVVAA